MATSALVVNKLQWKIDNFTKASLEANKGCTFNCANKFKAIFLQKESTWQASIKIQESVLEVYLNKIKTVDSSQNIKFTAYLVDKDGLQQHKKSFAESIKANETYRGWSDFVKVEDIFSEENKLIQDNKLIFGFELVLFKKDEPLAADALQVIPDDVLCKYTPFYNTVKFSDLNILCSDGVAIPAHRIVLCANSIIFTKMFETPMTESREKNITTGDINSEVMLEILRFMYSHRIENIKELAPKLIHGADVYDMQELKKLCVSTMIENLSVENAVEFFVLADRYIEEDMMEKCLKFIILNYYDEQIQDDLKALSNRLMRKLLKYFYDTMSPAEYSETKI